jgi:hypothetical protein
LVATCIICSLSLGCAHENIIAVNNPNAADWKLTPPIPASGKVFFIGRSLAVNILDERHGINAAIDDAAYQVAKTIVADVKGTVSIIDSRDGDGVRGKEGTEQTSQSNVRVDVAAIVSNVRQEDAYWERWSVREHFMGKAFKRYKYYVLASFPETELKRLQEDVKKKLQRD